MKTILSLDIVRGLLAGLAGTGAGMGSVMLLRLARGAPAWEADQVVVAGIIVGIIAYLVALGVFGYWFRWAAKGRQDERPLLPGGLDGAISTWTPTTRSSASNTSSSPSSLCRLRWRCSWWVGWTCPS